MIARLITSDIIQAYDWWIKFTELAQENMTRPTITEIENAFLPAREITDSKRFAGRKDPIRDAYYALISEGSNIAIVGNRGVGKTSLARQVINIGTGNLEILKKTGIAFDEKLDFLSIYMACGKQISSIDELLERLITSSNCLADWIYDIPNAKKIMVNYSPKFSANVFGVGVELGGTKETETTTSPVISSHSIDAIFTNIVEAITKENLSKNGILIVIDGLYHRFGHKGASSRGEGLAKTWGYTGL